MPNKNLHTLDLSLLAAEKDGKPYLGDLAVVYDLIGNLASSSLERVAMISQGVLTTEQAGEIDLEESRALAMVFLGKTPDYNGLKHWNEAGKIDVFVAEQADIAETDSVNRLATLFLLMIQDMYGAARMMDEGASEEDARTAIDGSLEGIAGLLMGIPFSDDAIFNHT